MQIGGALLLKKSKGMQIGGAAFLKKNGGMQIGGPLFLEKNKGMQIGCAKSWPSEALKMQYYLRKIRVSR